MPGIRMKTENDIVNKVGKMRFSGNVIPEVWYKTIVSSNGRVNLLAINILADIVYWYRPIEIRDEMTGDVTWKKKFADDDYLQRNYSKICEKYREKQKVVKVQPETEFVREDNKMDVLVIAILLWLLLGAALVLGSI